MRAAASILFLLTSVPASAGTAGGLLTACNSPIGSLGEQICSAYINGLGEGVLADQIAREDGTAICLPDNITTPQIRDAIKAFIDSKDVRVLQFPSGGVVAAALQATYPCPKSN
jgi:hypothetical protein